MSASARCCHSGVYVTPCKHTWTQPDPSGRSLDTWGQKYSSTNTSVSIWWLKQSNILFSDKAKLLTDALPAATTHTHLSPLTCFICCKSRLAQGRCSYARLQQRLTLYISSGSNDPEWGRVQALPSVLLRCQWALVRPEDTHPVKAFGLEEMSVHSVELPPSSGPPSVDRF